MSSYEQLQLKWEEDYVARVVQKEKTTRSIGGKWTIAICYIYFKTKIKGDSNRIWSSYEVNKIVEFKIKKNVDQILSSRQSSSNRCGFGYNSSANSNSQNNVTNFVPATVGANSVQPVETKAVSSSSWITSWVCHYCGKKSHIRQFCYSLQRDKFQHQKISYPSQKHKSNTFNQNGKRSRFGEWSNQKNAVLLLQPFNPQ